MFNWSLMRKLFKFIVEVLSITTVLVLLLLFWLQFCWLVHYRSSVRHFQSIWLAALHHAVIVEGMFINLAASFLVSRKTFSHCACSGRQWRERARKRSWKAMRFSSLFALVECNHHRVPWIIARNCCKSKTTTTTTVTTTATITKKNWNIYGTTFHQMYILHRARSAK